MKPAILLMGLLFGLINTTWASERPTQLATLQTLTQSKLYQCQFMYKRCRYDSKQNCPSHQCYQQRLSVCQNSYHKCSRAQVNSRPLTNKSNQQQSNE